MPYLAEFDKCLACAAGRPDLCRGRDHGLTVVCRASCPEEGDLEAALMAAKLTESPDSLGPIEAEATEELRARLVGQGMSEEQAEDYWVTFDTDPILLR